MPSAYDLYTFYLDAEHLKGRSVLVHIESVSVGEVFNPRIKRNEKKLIVRFAGKKLTMCLNKTQTAALIALTGSDNFDNWKGHTIMLTPTEGNNNRQTITITKPPESQPANQPVSNQQLPEEPPSELPDKQ